MRHVVLTRSAYRAGKRAQSWTDATIDERYIRYRMRLTRQFTIPSLAAQDTEFTWAVRLDGTCPLLDEQLLMLDECPFPTHAIIAGVRQTASDELATTDTDWHSVVASLADGHDVLTTRIDDDDAFAPDHFSRLRRALVHDGRPRSYVFTAGYCCLLHTQGSKFCEWGTTKNQFCSVLSPADELRTCVDRRHHEIDKIAPLVVVDRAPAYLWVRHPRRKSPGGRFRMTRPLSELAELWPFLKGRV